MGGSTTIGRKSRRVVSIMTGVGLLAGMLAISSGSAFAAGLFSNGSFETGTALGALATLTAVDSISITGWTVSTGTIDYIGTYWTASNGSRSLDMSGNGPGSISQTFATTAGVTYNVTFDLSGNPDGGPAIKTMTVDAGGAATLYSYDTSVGNTHANMMWAARTYSFVATAATTALTFTSTTATPYGPALDNVAVVAATLTCTAYSGSPTASVNFASGGASTTATGSYQPGDYFQCTSTAPGTAASWSAIHGQISPVSLTSTFADVDLGDGTNPSTAAVTYTAANGSSATVNFNLLPLSVAISGAATQPVGAMPAATASNAIGDGLGALGSNHQNITYSLSSGTPTATGTCTATPGTAALPATASTATSTLTGTSPGLCTATSTYTVSTVGSSTGFMTPFTVTASATVTFQSPTPSNKDACKDGGWKNLTDSQGHAFKNQGDCVSFVATKGNNLGDGTP